MCDVLRATCSTALNMLARVSKFVACRKTEDEHNEKTNRSECGEKDKVVVDKGIRKGDAAHVSEGVDTTRGDADARMRLGTHHSNNHCQCGVQCDAKMTRCSPCASGIMMPVDLFVTVISVARMKVRFWLCGCRFTRWRWK